MVSIKTVALIVPLGTLKISCARLKTSFQSLEREKIERRDRKSETTNIEIKE